MNAEPLTLTERIMAQHSDPWAPNGTYPMTCDIPEVGIRDYECRVSWELVDGRLRIDAIDFDGEDGAEGLDPNGTSLAKALYPRLASIAQSRREDILEAYYNSL